MAVSTLIAAAGAQVVGSAREADIVHVHFTDALWGPSIDAAAKAFRHWTDQVQRPLVLTVHDVPGFDTDRERDHRRRQGYRAVLEPADVVIVSSEHEAAAVRTIAGRPAVVIELPLVLPTTTRSYAAHRRSEPVVGVLGFIYPGKGHREIIQASAAAGIRRVAHLGTPSPGHASLAQSLESEALALGVVVKTSGYLSDADLSAAIAEIDIPVWSASGTNASASLVTWIAHQRRPIAVDSPISTELLAKHPQCATMVGPGHLSEAIAWAARNPGSTALATLPSWSSVGHLHLRAYQAARPQ